MIFRGVMKNGAKIVVKELIMEPGAEVSLFADFQREVSLMAQLHHENLVQMFGILLSPLRMVLELCSEGDLLGALRKGKIKVGIGIVGVCTTLLILLLPRCDCSFRVVYCSHSCSR